MIEIYCGDGKGKTTAAVGLAVRAAGHGIPVFFLQFMKDGGSGELVVLRDLPGVRVKYAQRFFGFFRSMSDGQRAEMKQQYQEMFEQTVSEVQQVISGRTDGVELSEQKAGSKTKTEISCVFVLDEVLHACNKGLLEENDLLAFLDYCPQQVEVVLTGREPSDELKKRADYISEIRKERHPYDRGVMAREGIEI